MITKIPSVPGINISIPDDDLMDTANSLAEYYKNNYSFFEKYDYICSDMITKDYWFCRLHKNMLLRQSYEIIFIMTDENDSQNIIGTITINNIMLKPLHNCCLSYNLDQNRHGSGYMTKALTVVMPLLFDEMNIHKIISYYLEENQKSAKLLNRSGFFKEGIIREFMEINGVWKNAVMMSLLNTSIT